jgi:hypothetical protein
MARMGNWRHSIHRPRKGAGNGWDNTTGVGSADRGQRGYVIAIGVGGDCAIGLDRCCRLPGHAVVIPLLISQGNITCTRVDLQKPSQTVRFGHRFPACSGATTVHSPSTHRPTDSPVNCRRTFSDDPLSERNVLIPIAPKRLDCIAGCASRKSSCSRPLGLCRTEARLREAVGGLRVPFR